MLFSRRLRTLPARLEPRQKLAHAARRRPRRPRHAMPRLRASWFELPAPSVLSARVAESAVLGQIGQARVQRARCGWPLPRVLASRLAPSAFRLPPSLPPPPSARRLLLLSHVEWTGPFASPHPGDQASSAPEDPRWPAADPRGCITYLRVAAAYCQSQSTRRPLPSYPSAGRLSQARLLVLLGMQRVAAKHEWWSRPSKCQLSTNSPHWTDGFSPPVLERRHPAVESYDMAPKPHLISLHPPPMPSPSPRHALLAMQAWSIRRIRPRKHWAPPDLRVGLWYAEQRNLCNFPSPMPLLTL